MRVALGRAHVSGTVDRVEVGPAGQVRVVDLKTGSSKPTRDEVGRHGQLGAYQLAVEAGAFADHGERSGGAALLQLGKAATTTTTLQVQVPLGDDDDPRWAHDLARRDRRPDGGGDVPGDPREPLRHLPGQGLLPRSRRGEAAVSADVLPGLRWSAVDLAEALGQSHAPTPEQAEVIEAPLRPLLVVAGAGSGKTETMAARVVWLVANGLVRPDEVLGLTFTRKAAGELSERLAARLTTLREAGLWVPEDEHGAAALDDVPTVSTYHAYAGRIVREHGLRLGVEPESRLLTEAAAWQFAHEAVVAWDGPMDGVTKAESTVTTAVVDLAGEMAEHLVDADALAAHLDEVVATLEAVPKGEGTRKRSHPMRAVVDVLRERAAVVPLVRSYHDLKRSRDAMDFADQMALAARIATHGAPGRGGRARPVQGGAARRVPGHLGGPAAAVAGAVRRGRRAGAGHRRGRPAPVDLRLAGRVVDDARPLPRRLPRRRRAGPRAPPVDVLAQRPGGPRRRERRRRPARRVEPGGGATARGARGGRPRPRRRRPARDHRGRGPPRGGVGARPPRPAGASHRSGPVPQAIPVRPGHRRPRGAPASPTRSSASAGCSTRPRSPTSSRCSTSSRTPRAATGSCACSPGRRAASVRPTSTGWARGRGPGSAPAGASAGPTSPPTRASGRASSRPSTTSPRPRGWGRRASASARRRSSGCTASARRCAACGR